MTIRFGLPILAAALLAACGESPPGDAAGQEAAAPAASDQTAPILKDEWVTIEGVQFPAAMAEAPDEIVEAYVFAAKHPEVLKYMPCYCGCHRGGDPHRNNYDCFVDAIDTSGELPRVDPDPMGFG